MHTEKVSEIIAHFIGLFDSLTDEMRLRDRYLEGRPHLDKQVDPTNPENVGDGFASDLALKDYDPGVSYNPGDLHLVHPHHTFRHQAVDEILVHARRIESPDRNVDDPRHIGGGPDFGRYQIVEEEELRVHAGPGSVIAHTAQVNLLQDDDYLNMTDGPTVLRDTTFVVEQLMEYSAEANAFTPFADLHRTDTSEGLINVYRSMRDYSQELQSRQAATEAENRPEDDHDNHDDHAWDDDQDNEDTHGHPADGTQIVLAASEIHGIYLNGELVDEAPKVDDFMPDRGIAKPAEEPDDTQTSVETTDPSGTSLDVAAGANVVANIVSIVETSVMSSVTAVMGNYYQVDAITQAYVYNDQAGSPLNSGHHSAMDGPETVANNIAQFERSEYGAGSDDSDADSLIFPTAWRVSVIEGDVSFVHWIEQYNFVTDNDTLTVTTSGTEATVLTGGNAVLNLASFLGIGMQYDLVIIGGDIYDINAITQISLLYDKDWIVGAGSHGDGDTDVQAGNNLLWNLASIHNIGASDRFEAMPDYINDTVDAIANRDPYMPDGLATDTNFAGYGGLNVLYITGNLFDINIVKQVSVLGDSDHVTLAANTLLSNVDDAQVSIDTGSNAVINIAEIIDYDSFGSTTYVAGQVYSDAILIQAGLVEEDSLQPQQPGDRLANEVIAFLDDAEPLGGGSDGVVDGGHDLSWSSAHPADVMQTVVA